MLLSIHDYIGMEHILIAGFVLIVAVAWISVKLVKDLERIFSGKE